MNGCPVEYWIWMQTALGAGARTDEILAYFGTPEQLYLAGSKEWRLSGLFTAKKIEMLKSSTPSEVGKILKECKAKGYKIITPDMPSFPKRLQSISSVPLALYVMGDESVLGDELCIGMVGTRNASDYGIETAQKLSYLLAKSDFTVVSGGALGIDSEAHAGAMLAKGRTIAFLGCGLSVNYLSENAPLRRAIAKHGAVVSEYSPFQGASKASFPIRNRLISGISLGVVVVEAGVKSGSLITANMALEQGRDVFAVPGDIVRSSFDGTNHLIKAGAKPVFSVKDVLEEYSYRYGETLNYEYGDIPVTHIEYVDWRKGKKSEKSVKEASQENKNTPKATREKAKEKPEPSVLPQEAGEEAKKVYSVLNTEGVHIDDIVRKTEMRMNEVLSSLTELELYGVVELMNGKKYKLI